MNWLSGLSSSEKREMEEDSCEAFQRGMISDMDFRLALGRLGYNATDIQDFIKQYSPEPPENADGDAD